MSLVVNTDPLTFTITNYGLERISEALYDPTVNLNLSKIKVGDANGSYYTPAVTQTSLVHQITNGSFYVIEKELLEDEETISFRIVIPETFSGCEIREVGLYETVNGVDNLFAVGTQQPFVKPSTDYKYFISVDYYLFLKSVNLADVYGQIVLDPDNQTVTTQDFEDLMSTIVFTQGNLSQQIGENSRLIGLNRGTQLYEKMVANRENYGYIETYNNYTTLLNYIDSSTVFGYWVFNYPRRVTAASSVIDIGPSAHNFSTSQAINLYDREYCGIMPTLKFNTPSYFYLDSSIDMSFVNTEINEDEAFSMLFTFKPLAKSTAKTLIARSNYATGTNVFEVNITATNALEVKLFADSSNYITFTSADNLITNICTSVALSYDNVNHEITAYINGVKAEMIKVVTGTYSHMNTAPTTLYGYAATPYEVIYANSSTTPLTNLYNSDGSPYTGSDWAIDSGAAKYKNNSSAYDSTKNVTVGKLYAWNYNDGVYDHTIYTKVATIVQGTELFNSNYSTYTGSEFAVVQSGSNWVVQYISGGTSYITTYTSSMDIASKTIYAWVYSMSAEKIWANDSSFRSDLFTKVGSPTVTDDGIASGFSSGNYINVLPNIGTLTLGSDFKIIEKFTTPTSFSGNEEILSFNNFGFIIRLVAFGYLNIFLSANGTSWDISNGSISSSTLQTNTTYYLKFGYDGTNYTISISTDNNAYTQIFTKTGTSLNNANNSLLIGYGTNGNPFQGSIDLKAFSITVDGEEVFSGAGHPSILLTSTGELYQGTDWTLANNVITYKNQFPATYNSSYNVSIPVLEATSYITDSTGQRAQLINSNVGIVSVIKSPLTDDELRMLSLNFEAFMGKNPCLVTNQEI